MKNVMISLPPGEKLDEYDEACFDSQGVVLIKWGATFHSSHLIDGVPFPRNCAEFNDLAALSHGRVRLLSGSYKDHLEDMAREHFKTGVCVN